MKTKIILFVPMLFVVQAAVASDQTAPRRMLPVKLPAKQAPGSRSEAQSGLPVRGGPAKSVARAPAKAAVKAQATKEAMKSSMKSHVSSSGDAIAWVAQVRSWSRTVRATDSATRAIGGSGFAESLALAIENQYIIVPWNFVSDTMAARDGAQFFVEGAQSPVELHLIDVDLGGDLALMKADAPLGASASRDRLRMEYPTADEPFFVLAARDWLRQGARFLKAKSDANAVRYQMALGSGDFAATRFVFDRAGRLTAIADSRSGSDGWVGSAKAVMELLRHQDAPRPASYSTADQTRRQVYFWQDRWTQSLTPNASSISLQNLDCQVQVPTVKEAKVSESIRSAHALECANHLPVELGAGYAAGLTLWTGTVTLTQPTSVESNLANDIEKSISEEAFADQERKIAMVNVVGARGCDEMVVTNSKGEKSRVRFCTSALKKMTGLGDTSVSVITMSEGASGSKMKYAVARMKAFDEAHSRRVLEAMVENIRSLP